MIHSVAVLCVLVWSATALGATLKLTGNSNEGYPVYGHVANETHSSFVSVNDHSGVDVIASYAGVYFHRRAYFDTGRCLYWVGSKSSQNSSETSLFGIRPNGEIARTIKTPVPVGQILDISGHVLTALTPVESDQSLWLRINVTSEEVVSQPFAAKYMHVQDGVAIDFERKEVAAIVELFGDLCAGKVKLPQRGATDPVFTPASCVSPKGDKIVKIMAAFIPPASITLNWDAIMLESTITWMRWVKFAPLWFSAEDGDYSVSRTTKHLGYNIVRDGRITDYWMAIFSYGYGNTQIQLVNYLQKKRISGSQVFLPGVELLGPQLGLLQENCPA